MKIQGTLISFIAILFILFSCGTELELGSAQHIETVTKQVNADRLENADNTSEDWLSYGKNYRPYLLIFSLWVIHQITFNFIF